MKKVFAFMLTEGDPEMLHRKGQDSGKKVADAFVNNVPPKLMSKDQLISATNEAATAKLRKNANTKV